MYNNRYQLLLTFGYDGLRFHGVQPQPGVPTAGAALRRRFLDAGATPKALCYSARTDAGVSAIRNIATCWLRDPSDPDEIVRSVTAPRNDGLLFVEAHVVPIHVHARANSRGKHYQYIIDDSFPPNPPRGERSWNVYPNLQIAHMQAAASHFVGEHDFAAFRAKRCSAQSTVKDMEQVVVRTAPSPGPGKRVVIDVIGNRFLRHMVRVMVGTLAFVGAGFISPRDIPTILQNCQRRAAGPTAPATGLTLIEVRSQWPLPPLPDMSRVYDDERCALDVYRGPLSEPLAN